MKHYRTAQEPVAFQIDDDHFIAVPTVPGEEMIALINKLGTLSDDEYLAVLYDFLEVVLIPESAQLFAERMRSKTNPIDIRTAMEVVADLQEHYTDRPTSASSPSANGSVPDVAGSPDGASPLLAVTPPS